MKLSVPLSAAALTAGLLIAATPFAFAQNSPACPADSERSVPPERASADAVRGVGAVAEISERQKSALRRKGDIGDPNGCNLKCPMDTQ
jgi:hypothetical protein